MNLSITITSLPVLKEPGLQQYNPVQLSLMPREYTLIFKASFSTQNEGYKSCFNVFFFRLDVVVNLSESWGYQYGLWVAVK